LACLSVGPFPQKRANWETAHRPRSFHPSGGVTVAAGEGMAIESAAAASQWPAEAVGAAFQLQEAGRAPSRPHQRLGSPARKKARLRGDVFMCHDGVARHGIRPGPGERTTWWRCDVWASAAGKTPALPWPGGCSHWPPLATPGHPPAPPRAPVNSKGTRSGGRLPPPPGIAACGVPARRATPPVAFPSRLVTADASPQYSPARLAWRKPSCPGRIGRPPRSYWPPRPDLSGPCFVRGRACF